MARRKSDSSVSGLVTFRHGSPRPPTQPIHKRVHRAAGCRIITWKTACAGASRRMSTQPRKTDSRPPKRIPFRERLPEPSANIAPRWGGGWPAANPSTTTPGPRLPASLVEGHLADRASTTSRRSGISQASRCWPRAPSRRSPPSFSSWSRCSARCRSTRRWPDAASPGRARSPCSRTC